MRRILALMLSVVALATFLYSCGKASSPAEKQEERKGRGQAETTAPEPTAPTSASGGASEGMSGKEQAARSEADCRLVLLLRRPREHESEGEHRVLGAAGRHDTHDGEPLLDRRRPAQRRPRPLGCSAIS